MKKQLKWLVPLLLVTAVAVFFWIRSGGSGPTQAVADPAVTTNDSRQAAAEVGEISVKLTETGLIQPKAQVLVKSKVSGKVARLHVRDGQAVRRGDLLASVEPDMAQARTVASLKSEYGRARVELERTRQDYERDLELHRQGHISESQIQLSKDAYDIAKIEYHAALEQMRLAEEDGVSMETNVEEGEWLEIVAPATGTIINLEIEEGEIVTSGAVSYTTGTTLMTIADLSTMQIKAGVNEVDIGKVRDGQEVAIDVDAYPGVHFAGTITHVAPAAHDEQGVKIFDVEIDIVDSDERLRPGMTANVEIQGDHCENALTVPVEAAFLKRGRYVVYVFDGSEQEPVEREVEAGIANIERLEIRSGVAEGELVALYDPEIEGRALSEDERRRQRMAAGGH